jgi:predicted TIM-barrel fold metal-dependent hydrolase
MESIHTTPKFDVHLHLHHGTVFLAEALMDRVGEVGGVNLSGGSVGRGLEDSLEEARKVGQGRILVFANLDYHGFDEPGWTEREVANLERAAQEGARGLKIFKFLGLGLHEKSGARVHVDDPHLAPIFDKAGELHLPVAIHTGDPKAFFVPDSPQNERHEELSLHPEWSFAKPGDPSWEDLYGEFVHLVKSHPQTTFIGVHFGNDPEEPDRVSKLLDECPNLYVDVAARLGEIGRYDSAKLHDIFIHHRKRILFGTDWGIQPEGMSLGASNGWAEELPDLDRFFLRHAQFFETNAKQIDHPTPIQGRWKIDAIDLPPDVRDDIYLHNAERLFDWKPVPYPQHG